MSDSEDEHIEKQLKIIFLGDVNIGKTSIVRRLCQNEFTRQYNPTIGADFYTKHLALPGRQDITLIISDLGGQELTGTMLDKYLYNINIIVLVYDITNEASFDSLRHWIDAVETIIDKPILTAVLGNKFDLQHRQAVRLEKIQQFGKQYNLQSCLVSAKTGECVNASISTLVAKYLGVELTKAEKDQQQPIVKAELIPPSAKENQIAQKYARKHMRSSAVCSVQ